MKTWVSGILLCLAWVNLRAASPRTSHQTAAKSPAVTAQKKETADPLIDRPLHLADFPNMQPRADLRAKLAHVSDFIQNSPFDGQPATEKTEVWMAHTKATLYFVFICYDRHPELIRGHLARRENILNDDGVAVLLDPFRDRRLGVIFRVNPAGVQADGAWSEPSNTDYSYDTVWDSDGRVTKEGWMALIAIPFRSLRFHSNESDWGVVLGRFLPRNSETDLWPRVAADVTGVLSQEGILHGIEGVSGSHNFQLNPYTLAQNERSLIDIDPTNPYFSSRHFEGTDGGEAKLILKDSIVIDATINPDFSDIESEQPQFTVDQRFPVYFPELRPFFLENANYFITPINLIYTRSIVHPEYGIRVTGKIDHTNVGLFVTDDRQPGQAVAPGDPLYGKHATVAVGRVSEDVGKGSSVGAIYTDEEFGQGWNRIGGIDFTIRFDKHWTRGGRWWKAPPRVTRTAARRPPTPPDPRAHSNCSAPATPSTLMTTMWMSAPALRRSWASFKPPTFAITPPTQPTSGFPKSVSIRASVWKPARTSPSITRATASFIIHTSIPSGCCRVTSLSRPLLARTPTL
jgi:hypothetical protein